MNDSLRELANQIYSRFSPFIRDYIYQSGWSELRQVQIRAAWEFFQTENHLLIASATASGKTEAAFFPVLSLMERESPENFLVLYISPLKSLINDQYSRMQELLKESGLPVYRWHGDANIHQKQEFLKCPKGILQITPESLESMLVGRYHDISRIFGQLKVVIIDEVHALMGSDRGSQILCQLQRISRLISYQPRRIALSATIGNTDSAVRWLESGGQRPTSVIKIDAEQTSWRLGLEHFYVTENQEDGGADPAGAWIYRATKGEKCVVFSNSREETENITATLRQIASKNGEKDRFYIHHGSLSATLRDEAEEMLREGDDAITACATVTLELGIDIGKLRRIVNQGAPTSVSSFLQRIGRSGRRGLPPEMLMVFRETQSLSSAPLYQLIPWDLLQAIAIIELYRKERWIEPVGEKKMPISLLFHQTISVLAGKGSLSAKKLCEELLELAPFSSFTKEDYREFLIHMLRAKYLELTEEKELIVGEKGEKLLGNFRFFAVFRDSEDFTVRSGSEEIGTVSSVPPVGERFALAGRVWEVEEVDVKRRLVYTKKVDGKMKISWPGNHGVIHTRILEKMQEILVGKESFPYLLPHAKERLENARILARNTGIGCKSILPLGKNRYVFFPWLGTKAFQTMKRILQMKIAPSLGLGDIQSGGCYFISFRSDRALPDDVIRSLYTLSQSETFSLNDLVLKTEYPQFDKFDSCLPQDLLRTAFCENHLEWPETKNRIQSLFQSL